MKRGLLLATRLPTTHSPSIPSKTRRPVRHTKSRGHVRGHPSMSLLQRKFCNGKHFVSWSFRCALFFAIPMTPTLANISIQAPCFRPRLTPVCLQSSILIPLSFHNIILSTSCFVPALTWCLKVLKTLHLKPRAVVSFRRSQL